MTVGWMSARLPSGIYGATTVKQYSFVTDSHTSACKAYLDAHEQRDRDSAHERSHCDPHGIPPRDPARSRVLRALATAHRPREREDGRGDPDRDEHALDREPMVRQPRRPRIRNGAQLDRGLDTRDHVGADRRFDAERDELEERRHAERRHALFQPVEARAGSEM